MLRIILAALICTYAPIIKAVPNQPVFHGSQKLQANKTKVVAACHQRGVSKEDTALILAVGMQETVDFESDQRDCSKDGNAHCRNYSAFNFNGDMLLQLYHPDENFEGLNNQAHIDHAVEVIIFAIKAWGVDRFLCFHRGGRAAFEDGCSYGAKEYKEAIHRAAKYLLENPAMMTNQNRVACEINHV